MTCKWSQGADRPENADSPLSCISFPSIPGLMRDGASTEWSGGHGMSWENTELKIKVFLFHRPGCQKVQRRFGGKGETLMGSADLSETFTFEGCRSSTEIWAEAWQNQRASRDSKRLWQSFHLVLTWTSAPGFSQHLLLWLKQQTRTNPAAPPQAIWLSRLLISTTVLPAV